MKNTFKLALVLMLVSRTAAAQTSRDTQPQCWNRDYDCFIREYSKRIAVEPANAENYYQRGVNLSKKFRYGEALKDFNKFLEMKPKAARGYSYRGTMYMHRASYSSAIADFDKAIELQPDFSYCFYSRGRSYFFQKKFAAAFADYDKSVELDPKDLSNYVARGETYKARGERELAEIDFKFAFEGSLKNFEAKPEDQSATAQLAYAYFFKSDYFQAINFYTKAIDLNLDDYQSYLYRGAAYVRAGRPDLALADFNRGIDLTPEYAEFYIKRADVYEKTGEKEKARADRRKYEELSKL